MIYPLQRTIAVDVDGTLLINGQPNTILIEWLRIKHQEGFNLILWSMGGEQHAKDVAKAFSIEKLFHVIISKPGYIVDDCGWSWVRNTKVVNDLSL